MSELPISEVLGDLRTALASHNVVILQAPPGAGKSTWLPLQLFQEKWLGDQKIRMLEPRRLAAKTVATRLAFHLNEETGEQVGYRIRFENKISSKTRLEILTEGILTRMLSEDPTLEGTGLVIFDEFHERSIHADTSLVLCREIQKVLRPDLRLLIMSATLDTTYLRNFFGDAPLISSEGKMFPVEMKYQKEDPTLPLPVQMATLIRKALQETEGDVLSFFPGTGEIRRAAEILENERSGVNVVPLYGDLGWKEQQEAILPDPAGIRKVVLATSIAETSLTIEGIRVVIDSGYSRVPKFDPNTGLTRLDTIKVTKDVADQRAGRAGRLSPGVAYRLWEEGKTQFLIPHRKPEILEADLAPLMMEFLRFGKKDLLAYDWVTPPPLAHIQQAQKLLEDLGALEGNVFTEAGKAMAAIPIHPRFSHMFLEAKKAGTEALACDLAALLEERNPVPKEQGVNLALGLDLLKKYRRKESTRGERGLLERIEKTSQEWRRRIRASKESPDAHDTTIGHLLAFAYPERIAKKISGNRYRMANGRTAALPEHDPLAHEEWIAIGSMDLGKNEGKIFMAAPLDPDDVQHLAQEREVYAVDEQRSEIITVIEKHIGGIILGTKNIQNPDPQKLKAVLETLLRSRGSALFETDDEGENLLLRLRSLHRWDPERWPEPGEEYIIKLAIPYLEGIRKVSELKKTKLHEVLLSGLTWEQQQELARLVPITLEVPSGSHIRLEYFEDGRPPVLAVRLQELFGMLETPAIMKGKIKVMVHLLSPGYKPVQVTQDLQNFWKNTYHEVRKELRVRYPKHSWPEDPFTAKAVRGVKKRSK